MKHILLLGFFFFICFATQATHIVGGEFNMVYLNGNTYQLTLNMYFDQIYGNREAIDPYISVSVFEKSENTRIQEFLLPLKSNTPVLYSSVACTNSALSTEKIVYETTITLPSEVYNSPAGYYVTWERCCRNNAINNISQPGSAGQTFYLEFPAVIQNNVSFINSSPALFPPVRDYACRDELFYYDFAGTDADGDSLVYEMAVPLNGYSRPGNPVPVPSPAPYPPVNWIGGATDLDQIPGNPSVRINARSGLLTLRPTQLGLFSFAVKCSEYRNKIKIGEVRRDFQILVLECPRNEKPWVAAKSAANSYFYAAGDTVIIKASDSRCLDLFLTDTEPNSVLTVEALPVNFTVAEKLIPLTNGLVNPNGIRDTLKTQVCFPECLSSGNRVLLVDFILSDQGCSLPQVDTLRLVFILEPIANHPPEIKTSATEQVIRLQPGQNIQFEITATDSDQDLIALAAQGQGFKLADYGMEFTPVTGNGQAKTTFSWTPVCNATDLTSFTVDFILTETACNPLGPGVVSVKLEVDYNYSSKFKPANIFTPNNDNLNDYFTIPNLPDYCQNLFTGIKIYNRWGNLVYQSQNRHFKWDGKNVSDGVYYYTLSFQNQAYKGTVTLVR